MPLVISVEHLSKSYHLGQIGTGTVSRDLEVWWAKLLGKPNPLLKIGETDYGNRDGEELWALQDVSFSVEQGEVLGIIGRNGAGKSTLLKILSRVTAPTSGKIKVKGRIASLLEVGTGFHPELTGRENIYLNGAILGMKHDEITRKFGEIVDFSGIEKFIDTPVKRYSSGMYVRLAFAVAAHLDPEILVVDEVLAVGDAEFQKKCLGKMGDVAKEGRTVLFVSHNMAAVENLCRRGLVLNNGQLQFAGTQTEAISCYLQSSISSGRLEERTDRKGSGVLRVTDIQLLDREGNFLDTLTSGQDVNAYLYFQITPGIELKRAIASISLKTSLDIPVFLQHNRLTRDDFGLLPLSGAFVCSLEHLPLPPSIYKLSYSVMMDGEYLDGLTEALEVTVVDGNYFGSGEVPPISHGVCLVNARWSMIPG
jgi:lipopolysaccharide transport system ATP-binding protein